jgi:hypothetical protein
MMTLTRKTLTNLMDDASYAYVELNGRHYTRKIRRDLNDRKYIILLHNEYIID